MNKLGETMKNEIQDLERIRDELRVQLRLGATEAREAWKRLEAEWPRVEEKLHDFERASSDAANGVATATKRLVAEVRDGYRKLRRGAE